MADPKPPIYALYRTGHRSTKFVVIQIRHHETGEPVSAADLSSFTARKPINTGYYRIKVGTGSLLFLTPETSKIMADAGTISPILSEILIPWRVGELAEATKKGDFGG